MRRSCTWSTASSKSLLAELMSQDTSRFDTGCVSTARRVSHAYRGFSFCLLTMGFFYFSPFECTLKSVTQGSVPPSEIFVWGAYFYNKTREPLFRGSNGPELPIGAREKKVGVHPGRPGIRVFPIPGSHLCFRARWLHRWGPGTEAQARTRASQHTLLALGPPLELPAAEVAFFRVCFMLRPGGRIQGQT